MVNVIKFEVTPGTGFTEMILFFRVHGKEVTDKVTFAKEENARKYFHSTQRTVFFQHIESYVLHKKHILESDNYQHKASKQESLSVCLNYINWMHSETTPTLAEICKFGLVIKSHLEKILPNENNNSYQRSRENLALIMSFCKGYKDSLRQILIAA